MTLEGNHAKAEFEYVQTNPKYILIKVKEFTVNQHCFYMGQLRFNLIKNDILKQKSS